MIKILQGTARQVQLKMNAIKEPYTVESHFVENGIFSVILKFDVKGNSEDQATKG